MKEGQKRFQHKCLRCGYDWLSKLVDPVVCPYCNSALWNRPYAKEKRELTPVR